MWDQIYHGTLFRVNVPTGSAGLNDPALATAAVQAYLDSASGPLSVAGTGMLGFEKLPLSRANTDILHFIRGNLAPVWHAAATCKMGNASDAMAVVDTNMRVYGVEGLRVVDASSFLFHPPGHPQATIYPLAEKAARAILHELRHPIAIAES